MKKVYSIALAFCVLAGAMVACTKEQPVPDPDVKEEEKLPDPTVKAEFESAEAKSVQLVITPTDAVKCAYKVYGVEETPQTAEEILAEGVAAHANESSTVVVTGLEPNTEYQFAVAVLGKSGATALYVEKVTTGDVPPVVFDTASGRLYGGSVPNFGVTLSGTADGVKYDLSLDLYDYEVSGITTPQSGTYVASSEQTGKVLGVYYAYISIADKMIKLKDGSVTIEAADGNYKMDIRLVLEDGTDFHGVFDGAIENF